MRRIALAIVVVLAANLWSPAAKGGDVFRSISKVVDPVVAPRAPDPDAVLPPLTRTSSTPRPATPQPVFAGWASTWSGSLRFPSLPLPTLPARTASRR